MTGAISQLGLKVRRWDSDEVLEYAGFVIDNLPLPAFVGSYLDKWFPNFRFVLQLYIAASLDKFLSALPGDEIEVKNVLAPNLISDIKSLDENPPEDPETLKNALDEARDREAILTDLNDDLTLAISELQETEADLRAHIADLQAFISGDSEVEKPPPAPDDENPETESIDYLPLVLKWEESYRDSLSGIDVYLSALPDPPISDPLDAGRYQGATSAKNIVKSTQVGLLSRPI